MAKLPRIRIQSLTQQGGGRIKKICPRCGQLAPVGGPVNGWFIIRPHGSDIVRNILCRGTGEKVR